MALISAHRCGPDGQPALENTRAGIERSLDGGAEYVEFDVQRDAGGAFVLSHGPVGSRDGRALCGYEEALGLLAAGGKLAHIDFKFFSAGGAAEVRAAQIAREIMGDAGFLITSLEDRSVRAVRDWADAENLDVPVGLSLGRGLAETPWVQRPGVRLGELAPRRRVTETHANLVVCHRNIARLGVARWTARQHLPLLVWTVDAPERIRAWLSDPRVWMLTTNRPELACAIRRELAETDGLRR